jgi:hypothetical protein
MQRGYKKDKWGNPGSYQLTVSSVQESVKRGLEPETVELPLLKSVAMKQLEESETD